MDETPSNTSLLSFDLGSGLTPKMSWLASRTRDGLGPSALQRQGSGEHSLGSLPSRAARGGAAAAVLRGAGALTPSPGVRINSAHRTTRPWGLKDARRSPPALRCGQRSALQSESSPTWRGSSPRSIMILPRSPRCRPQHARRITKAMESSRGRRDARAHACRPGCSEATMRRDAVRRREARKRPRSSLARTPPRRPASPAFPRCDGCAPRDRQPRTLQKL